MSDRERWIIYPLLFLALGSSIWGKLTKQIASPLVRCQELEIVGPDDDVLIKLSARAPRAAGEIHVYGANSRYPLASMHGDSTGNFGMIECRDSDGRALAVVGGTNAGHGRIAVHDRQQTLATGLSHDGPRSGLSVSDLRTGEAFFLPRASVARLPSPTPSAAGENLPTTTPPNSGD